MKQFIIEEKDRNFFEVQKKSYYLNTKMFEKFKFNKCLKKTIN